jgi:hypothetical protein
LPASSLNFLLQNLHSILSSYVAADSAYVGLKLPPPLGLSSPTFIACLNYKLYAFHFGIAAPDGFLSGYFEVVFFLFFYPNGLEYLVSA